MLKDANGFKKIYLAVGTTDLRKGIKVNPFVKTLF